jgi:hypothetical protein
MTRERLDTVQLDVNFETETLAITVDGVKVSTIGLAEIIRRERVLQAPVDGECRASIDRIPGDENAVRVLLEVGAAFTEFEALGLSVAGTFPELVVQRIASPVRRAIMKLFEPQKGRIILP